MIVVDASLGVKWYLDEAWSDQADALLVEHDGDIAVPDIFLVEVASALVRAANIDKARRTEIDYALAQFRGLFAAGSLLAVRPGPDTISMAARLALDLGHPIKDCLYLALAMELDCELVTCDRRFAVKTRDEWARIRILGD